MHEADLLNTVKCQFENYLAKQGLRKTQERFLILEHIYTTNKHFNAEQIYLELKQKSKRISRATVYNTLELLLKAGLVIKLQFDQQVALYERAYQRQQHQHIICLTCHQVFEFCDPRLALIIETAQQHFHLEISKHSLTLYGHCKNPSCKRKNDGNHKSR